MQRVSQAYKKSMKSSLRERAYIMLSFGLVNQEVQSHAKIDSGDFAYYSSAGHLFDQKEGLSTYGTLEQDFTTVDGSMKFLPREKAGMLYLDTGLVSKGLVSEGTYELTVNFHVDAIDFKGLTIDFGENYPTSFDISGSQGVAIEVRDNIQSIYTTETVIADTTFLKLTVYAMKNEHSRFRVRSILFGYGLVFGNSSVTDSTLESYVSPISEDVPQIDFSVTLKNYDQYFNPDNPNSAFNFLETGQEMEISYGYQLPDGDIEWVEGNKLLCAEWESDDSSATIKCQDVFRNMESEYYKGTYTESGVSFYDLAETVLKENDEENYYIDPRLKKLYSKNPLPRSEAKQLLQIIANACRCVLSQTRSGQISIKSNFLPEVTASSNGETDYSNVVNVTKDDTKGEYLSLATNYGTADGGMYFLPRDATKATVNTGFVSSTISKEDCTFDANPTITLTLEAQCAYYGLTVKFGKSVPAALKITTYNNNVQVESFEVLSGIETNAIIIHEFEDFDKLVMEFTKTSEPFNRIVVNSIVMGDITDFTMERRDMLSSPSVTRQELVKDITVPCYVYHPNTEAETLVSEEVTVKSGDTITYYLTDASYGYTAALQNVSGGVSIPESGSFYVTVAFTVAGTYQLDVTGYKYKIAERNVTVKLNNRGKSIVWENPMISDMDMAQDLADWLADYYRAGTEYEYDTRGNPELDANDTIYQCSDFGDAFKVNAYRTTLNFKQAFSGSVVTRKVGG